MDRILQLITDPVFWFSVVIVGVAVSVSGNYATDGTKWLLGKFSARQRERNRKEKEKIEYLGRLCAANPSYLSVRISDAAWFQTEANSLTIVASVQLLWVFILIGAMNPNWMLILRNLDLSSPSTVPPFDPLFLTKIPVTTGRFWLPLFVLLLMGFEFYFLCLAYRYRTLSKYNLRIISRARNIIRKEMEGGIKLDQDDASAGVMSSHWWA